MKLSLKDAFQAHYEAEQLNTDQMLELNRLLATAEPESSTSMSTPGRRTVLASVAMVILLMLFGGGVYQALDGVFYSMPERIAAEVAKNHLKMRPLELKTDAMSDVQHYFSALDFMPTESKLFAGANRQLLGGRYCSIQGITAAQLRYQNGDDGLVTLYETQYDPKTFKDLPDINRGEQPLLLYSRGLQVKIWVEKDVLMVEAVK